MKHSVDDLTLSERLGLLRAVCEERNYFSASEVEDHPLPRGLAIERYGEDGVPAVNAVRYSSWGGQPVVAGMLTEPDAGAALPYLRCAVVAQQSMGTKSVDMLVMLIGPDGSSDKPEWASAAAAIEDDARVCRKLVWLPNGDLARSAEKFVTRSPFAKPWRGATAMASQVKTLESLIGEEDELDIIAYKAETSGASALEFIQEALSSRRPA